VSADFKKDRFEQNAARVAPALEALDLICGDRDKDYGGTENFTRIAERWSQHFGNEVETWEICLLMMDLKLSRLINEYKRDSVVDIIGYACLLVELYDGRNKGRDNLFNQPDRGAEAHPVAAD
jgi:hypothetical protein